MSRALQSDLNTVVVHEWSDNYIEIILKLCNLFAVSCIIVMEFITQRKCYEL